MYECESESLLDTADFQDDEELTDDDEVCIFDDPDYIDACILAQVLEDCPPAPDDDDDWQDN